MIGNVTGNDTGNVSRTCKHIIAEKIKLVNTNSVKTPLDAYRIRFYAYSEPESAQIAASDCSENKQIEARRF